MLPGLAGFRGIVDPLAGEYLIAGGGIGSTTTTTLSLTYPSVQAGDLLVAIGQIQEAVTISAPGWTDYASTTYTLLHFKTATGSETGTQNFTISAAQDGASGEIIRIRNTGLSSPRITGWNGSFDADGSVNLAQPAGASGNGRDLVLAFVGFDTNLTQSVAPSGYTAISSKTTDEAGFTSYASNISSNYVATYSGALNWRMARINVV